ncbi:MAG: tetratricopeptide (TPR) repeat protein [Planctomycetota bacterium]|jgi:tetratricopeptide (TPR) repeat protein
MIWKLLILVSLSCVSCASLGHTQALLIEGSGDHQFKISTDDPEAQTYFDQGLALSYGFNHAEAIRSFKEVAHLDSDCAMAYWGQAYALGPNMNSGVDEEGAKAAAQAIAKAMEMRMSATELERDLIEALATRLARPVHEDREIIDGAYAGAMRALWVKYPENDEVGFLYADALVNETPWELWSADFEPNRNTEEIIAVLDRVLELNINHPGANHFYIHTWEPSGEPARAEAAADRLGALTPGLGHMVHMPGHIYVQVGRYEDCVRVNDIGARLDREYFERAGEQVVYHFYQAHNTHFRVWAALYMGAYEEALEACAVLLEDLPDHFEAAPSSANWLVMDQEVHLRFGKWQAVLDVPKPREDQPIAQALWHYARAVAYANTDRIAQARGEVEHFEQAVSSVPADADLEFVEDLNVVMDIARNMMAGEIEYKAGNVEAGLDFLRKAVEAEDKLEYSEPSPWLVPTRHSLGALLLEQGQLAEAEEHYRYDLKLHPGNIWSLHGLTECLERTNQTAAAAEVRAQLERVQEQASVEVNASCYCRTTEG